MSAGATATYTYDGNGNMTGDGSRTFQWDAKNRLTRIVYSGTNASTEMAYDGLDRRVSIVEKDGTGTVVSSSSFRVGWALHRLISESGARSRSSIFPKAGETRAREPTTFTDEITWEACGRWSMPVPGY